MFRDKTPEQIELFSKPQDAERKTASVRSNFFSLYLSFDNCLVLSITLILLLIISFSLGVEKGKRSALAKLTIEPLKEANVVVDKNIRAQKTESAAEIKTELVEKKQETIAAQDSEASEKKELPSNKYTIQVASYSQSAHAKKESEKLKKEGYQTYVLPKGKYIALCVGSFENATQAKASQSKLKKRYNDCYVRRL